ncbi:hypothetical protein E2562_029765 [Oryza meyeriana var. granulata]|uniref:DUF4220 domain-containing protein n=1 Tax=Oryza meyeriana var. granulata TaxID=110450 RepID=A0A6G1E417_9ORYZ|nr:hypothetical protein E2562_029765 [Oryza meyeriana var. granulata]KAF0919531.1 hypothetical protein E2562_029765 [Oryza meyeriana var. granulata]
MGRVGCLCFLLFLSCLLVLVYESIDPDAIFGQANHEGAKATKEKDGFNPPIILLGGWLSELTYLTPYMVHWSTGSNPNALKTVYTNADFMSAGIATLAWLSFSLCQLHGANGKIVGAPAAIIYSIGLMIYFVTLVFKWSSNGVVTDVVCHTSMLTLVAIVILLLVVGVHGALKREHKIAKIISALAALALVVSSLLPYGDLRKRCIRPDQAPATPDQEAPNAQVPRVRNKRKLVVYIRSLDAGSRLYWAVYCIYHYDHTYFWIANIASVILSWIAASISISEALRPAVGDDKAEAAREELFPGSIVSLMIELEFRR